MAANYTLTFARSARKELEKLPISTAEGILGRVEALQQNPRPSGALKLQGETRLWRLRVGDYRVIYSIDDAAKMIDISMVRHRRDVYRDL
jgi:mRNA interferase RelE/StbE